MQSIKNTKIKDKKYLRNIIIQRHKDLTGNNQPVKETNKLIMKIHQKTGKPIYDILREINALG